MSEVVDEEQEEVVEEKQPKGIMYHLTTFLLIVAVWFAIYFTNFQNPNFSYDAMGRPAGFATILIFMARWWL